ncbi:hypothetical protein ABZ752_22680 [Streptomyces roseifaciens]
MSAIAPPPPYDVPLAGAVPALWRALLTGPWRRAMPVQLRRSRFLVALYVAARLADAAGRIPALVDGERLVVLLARSCATSPATAARYLAAAATAGALTPRPPGGWSLSTTTVPDWTAALHQLDHDQEHAPAHVFHCPVQL